MNLSFSISLKKIFLIILFLNVCGLIAIGQDQNNIPAASFPEWVRDHLALMALVVSEIIAFLPAKFSGIIKTGWTIFEELFKKKST